MMAKAPKLGKGKGMDKAGRMDLIERSDGFSGDELKHDMNKYTVPTSTCLYVTTVRCKL